MKYGFIGFGNLAQAIYKGLKNENEIAFACVTKGESDCEIQRFETVEALATFADVIWICVKPVDVPAVLEELRHADLATKMLVSPVAGKSISFIEGIVGADKTIARIMPNLAVAYGKSVTAYVDNSESEITKRVKEDLLKLGKLVELPERHFDLFTAIFGSGPAFLLEVLGVYQKKTLELGLSEEMAGELLEGLADGTMTYFRANTDKNVSELTGQIASKGGVTEAGLNVLRGKNLVGLLEEVLEASREKSEELGE